MPLENASIFLEQSGRKHEITGLKVHNIISIPWVHMGVSKNNGTPKSSHVNRVFHYFHHPFWVPLFLETSI